MPGIEDIVTVNTYLEVSAVPAKTWGTPAVVGESDYTTKNKPVLYSSLSAVKQDHGDTSNVTKAAQAIFAQGVRKLYVVSMEVASAGSPTADEVDAALNSLADLALQKKVNGVCLAMIPSNQEDTNTTKLATKLKAFADAYGVIFTVTNENGEAVADIITDAGELSSPNGMYIAHADSNIDEDVAAAALGVIMVHKPWHTISYKFINVGVNEYFSENDRSQLEQNNVACVIEGPNGENRISAGYTLAGDPKFIDVTRTKYYAMTLIDDRITSLRLRATKIPYTELGLAMIYNEIASALEEMVRVGALSSYTIVMPALEDIPDDWKAQRVLKDVYITAVLAGDVETFELNLTITV